MLTFGIGTMKRGRTERRKRCNRTAGAAAGAAAGGGAGAAGAAGDDWFLKMKGSAAGFCHFCPRPPFLIYGGEDALELGMALPFSPP